MTKEIETIKKLKIEFEGLNGTAIPGLGIFDTGDIKEVTEKEYKDKFENTHLFIIVKD